MEGPAEERVPCQMVADTLFSAFRRAAFRRIEGGLFHVRGLPAADVHPPFTTLRRRRAITLGLCPREAHRG
jgi:hypothetical protein